MNFDTQRINDKHIQKIQSSHESESMNEAATESRELGQALRAVERTDAVIVVQQLQFLLKNNFILGIAIL